MVGGIARKDPGNKGLIVEGSREEAPQEA